MEAASQLIKRDIVFASSLYYWGHKHFYCPIHLQKYRFWNFSLS
jgi:hypothetical protein